MLGEQATDGVDVLVLEVHADEVLELLHRQPGVDPHGADRQALVGRRLGVVLVHDLADDLLEHVLDRHQTSGPAVLVDDDHHVVLLRLHLGKQRVDRLAVRHEHGRPHHRDDPLGRLALVVLVQATGDVLEVRDTDDVVLAVAYDRDAAEAAAQRERQALSQRLRALDEHHVRARHHHLARQGVAQLEDRVDHLPLARLDELARLREVHHLAQLGLRREGALGEALAGSNRVAHHDQQLRQGTDHAREHRDRPGAGERDAVGPLATQRAWADADNDEGDDEHRGRGHQHGDAGRGEHVQADDGHEDRGGQLAREADEQCGVEGWRRVLEQRT